MCITDCMPNLKCRRGISMGIGQHYNQLNYKNHNQDAVTIKMSNSNLCSNVVLDIIPGMSQTYFKFNTFKIKMYKFSPFYPQNLLLLFYSLYSY